MKIKIFYGRIENVEGDINSWISDKTIISLTQNHYETKMLGSIKDCVIITVLYK